ncbi:MAG: protein SCO1/2 [Candidatus Latescibacterota bacterium]|jgi:protein SCO1/2
MGKKNSYIGLSAVILIFGIIFIPRIVKRLKSNTVVEDTRMSNFGIEDETTNVGKMISIGKAPQFTFVNQNNDTISQAYYSNKIYVVEFFFTTCPSICPIMTTNMLKIQEAFKDDANFGIASISIDPEYDTPAILKQYADGYGATHPNWNFLTGEKAAIHTLSNEGFKIYANENMQVEGGFEHQGLFALIDASGEIVSSIDKWGNPIIYYSGLEDTGIEMLIQDIKKLQVK